MPDVSSTWTFQNINTTHFTTGTGTMKHAEVSAGIMKMAQWNFSPHINKLLNNLNAITFYSALQLLLLKQNLKSVQVKFSLKLLLKDFAWIRFDNSLFHQAPSSVLLLGVLVWSLSCCWQYASGSPEKPQSMMYKFTAAALSSAMQMKQRYASETGDY